MTAPISPGNSGGAVFSEDGKEIGVVSFKLTAGEALNFAIPINYAQDILKIVSESKLPPASQQLK